MKQRKVNAPSNYEKSEDRTDSNRIVTQKLKKTVENPHPSFLSNWCRVMPNVLNTFEIGVIRKILLRFPSHRPGFGFSLKFDLRKAFTCKSIMAAVDAAKSAAAGGAPLPFVPPPRTQMIIRRKESCILTKGPAITESPCMTPGEGVPIPSCGEIIFSNAGDRFLSFVSDGIAIFDAESGAQIQLINRPAVAIAAWSSMGSYILTWEKMTPEIQNNLIVWSTSTATQVTAFPQKNFDRESWPSVQWSEDEVLACRLATDQVMIYRGSDMAAGQTDSLRVAGPNAC